MAAAAKELLLREGDHTTVNLESSHEILDFKWFKEIQFRCTSLISAEKSSTSLQQKSESDLNGNLIKALVTQMKGYEFLFHLLHLISFQGMMTILW